MTPADIWAVMPFLILAVGALLVLLLGAAGRGRYGTAIGVAALAAAAACCLPAPPGGALPTVGVTLTPFARFFTVLFSLTAAITLLLSHGYNERRGIRGEEYAATVLFAAFGMGILSSSSNLLILFLGLEGLTFAFYFLVAIDRERAQSGEAGLKYLLLGAVAAAFTAFGIALMYAGAGSLEVVPMMKALSAGENTLTLAGSGFLLAGVAFKVSLVPAHLWTPDVYEGAPAPVVAFLSTASKGAAVVFLLLLLTAAGVAETLRAPLWVLSLLSMVVGNIAALVQKNLKRMLAYSAIAQMGYVTLALLSGAGGGYGAATYYLVAYTAMNLAAFGAVASLTGADGASDRVDYLGLGYRCPFRGGVLALAMFALAGIPPTAGFVGKFFIFSAALRGGETPLAVVGILTAVVSIYYYLRVVVDLYMRAPASGAMVGKVTPAEFFSLAAAAIAVLILGIFPAPLMDMVVSLFQ